MITQEITKERLQGWEKRCNDLGATPQVLIALNPNTHELGVIVTEEMPVFQIRILLSYALQKLKE